MSLLRVHYSTQRVGRKHDRDDPVTHINLALNLWVEGETYMESRHELED
jgi:hypothetical protein